MRPLKYILAYAIPGACLAAVLWGGAFTFFPLVFAFMIVPLAELLLKPDHRNLTLVQAEMASNDPIYDWILWLMVPFQWFTLLLFLHQVNVASFGLWELAGMTACMGILCGIIGINVGHELGHRPVQGEQLLAKLLLLSSLYMHFFIEHNRGHHKKVATPDDPASARFNESLYAFWVRSVVDSYRSAWSIENARMKKNGWQLLGFRNEMLQYHVIQLGLLAAIGLTLGAKSLIFFIVASLIGILLLEAVNYIEHYGLARHQRADGTYGRTLHCHSWNSDHVLGRILLLELSRHSDHHFKASKKYQLLNHIDESPQMPTGYPGMILLALVPPLFFKVVNPVIEAEMKRIPDLALAV